MSQRSKATIAIIIVAVLAAWTLVALARFGLATIEAYQARDIVNVTVEAK